MKQRLSILVCLMLLAAAGSAQELRCNVTVNSDQVEGSSKQLFQTLQQSITDFMNTSRWTTLTFAEKERIECSMLIVVKKVTTEGDFSCEMTLQSRRPVWGTTYSTPLLNMRDENFNFVYQESDRLEYQQSTFTTNLTAMLAYYCYLIIGFDLDSYSRLGGSPCFQVCEDIVSMAQSAPLAENEQGGWKAFGSSKNRYTLTNNLMDEAFKPFRNYFYEYHRLGLDEMQGNVSNARARIYSGLGVIKEAHRARPTAYLVNTFLDAKSDELVNIFHDGTGEEKKGTYNLLMDIDPTRQNTYDKINE